MTAILESDVATLAARYERNGFALTPPILPDELVRRAVTHMDAVIRGEYETGQAPSSRRWNPGDDPLKICKINDAQLADRTLLELVSHPEIGRWAAALTGANRVQVWATQLLFKPPGGADAGNVGWHQDRQYWRYWSGEVFTAWVALSDVTAETGPIRFVQGSHRWGEIEGGDFFGGNLDALRAKMNIPGGAVWEEAEGVLPAGAVSFHHRLTIHGSGPNCSQGPRRSIALHLRTEKSALVPGVPHHGYGDHLDDPRWSPILHEA